MPDGKTDSQYDTTTLRGVLSYMTPEQARRWAELRTTIVGGLPKSEAEEAELQREELAFDERAKVLMTLSVDITATPTSERGRFATAVGPISQYIYHASTVDYAIIELAADVLREIGDVRAIPPLIHCIRHAKLRHERVPEAITSFGDQAVPLLIESLKGDSVTSFTFRHQLVAVLKALTGQHFERQSDWRLYWETRSQGDSSPMTIRYREAADILRAEAQRARVELGTTLERIRETAFRWPRPWSARAIATRLFGRVLPGSYLCYSYETHRWVASLLLLASLPPSLIPKAAMDAPRPAGGEFLLAMLELTEFSEFDGIDDLIDDGVEAAFPGLAKFKSPEGTWAPPSAAQWAAVGDAWAAWLLSQDDILQAVDLSRRLVNGRMLTLHVARSLTRRDEHLARALLPSWAFDAANVDEDSDDEDLEYENE